VCPGGLSLFAIDNTATIHSPLVVSPIVGTTCLTKVLMDRGSSLKILYDNTLDKISIPRSNLHPSKAPKSI
jgi:hypothetical protein